MTISQIMKALDSITKNGYLAIGEREANSIIYIESEWRQYEGQNLGEVRKVIEDRILLANSLKRRAGF